MLTKCKRRKLKENLTNMLNDAMYKNPQAVCKIIDEMKRDAVLTVKSEKINRKECFDHFQKLLTPENSQDSNEIEQHVKNDLAEYENSDQTCIPNKKRNAPLRFSHLDLLLKRKC